MTSNKHRTTLPKAQWRGLFPYASRYLVLPSGLRMHYVDEGSAEHTAGAESTPATVIPKTILAVHGNPTWAFYWRRIVAEFSPTRRVVAPDHIGCGWSDRASSSRYTLAQRIYDLGELITQRNLNGITLVVHDWGGAIGLGLATQMPERFERLVILNTGAFPPPYVPWRIRLCRTPLIGAWAMRRLNAFAQAATWMAVGRKHRLAPEVRAGLLAPYDTAANREGIVHFVQDIPFTRSHPTWSTLQQIEQDLTHLAHLPKLMIWGMQDWCFTPTCLNRFLSIWPDASVRRIDHAGHYVMEDAADEVIALMREFLT